MAAYLFAERMQAVVMQALVLFTVSWTLANGFAPASLLRRNQLPFPALKDVRASSSSSSSSSSSLYMMPMDLPDLITATTTSSSWLELFGSNSLLLSFSDQGQNLAGIFFQASLLPYLFFLYFLSFRANRLSDLANFGFQFVLLFVLSTIPSGIISKATYGVSLANVDWLHGGAETLLTVANVLIVRCKYAFRTK